MLWEPFESDSSFSLCSRGRKRHISRIEYQDRQYKLIYIYACSIFKRWTNQVRQSCYEYTIGLVIRWDYLLFQRVGIDEGWRRETQQWKIDKKSNKTKKMTSSSRISITFWFERFVLNLYFWMLESFDFSFASRLQWNCLNFEGAFRARHQRNCATQPGVQEVERAKALQILKKESVWKIEHISHKNQIKFAFWTLNKNPVYTHIRAREKYTGLSQR